MSETTKLCPKCKEEIQKDAKKCKHCNADLRSRFARHKIITGIGAFILLIVIIGSANPSDTIDNNTATPNNQAPQEIIEESIKISAIDLVAAYEANEVKADSLYKSALVEINGVIKDIGVIFGDTYITLESGKEFSISDIQCIFNNKEEINKVGELTKGDSITLLGKVDGKSMNVVINNCKII